MGIAPSSPTLPVMTCTDLASLAEANDKADLAGIVRDHGIDGACLEDGLDDDMLQELAPDKKMQQRKMKVALAQLMEQIIALRGWPVCLRLMVSSRALIPHMLLQQEGTWGCMEPHRIN